MKGRLILGEELDRIGTLGELHFRTLCEKAKLKCSKVEPDKTGKDFVVEFNLEPAGKSPSIDKRPAPIQVLVQVKTILAKNDTVKVALSVAERLAKDTRPAIIAILRIDDDDEIVDMHFIHIIDSPLARILKALRRASTEPDPHLHEMTISFRTTRGEAISSKVAEFYGAVAALSGGDMLAYAARKKDQIEGLGFAPYRFNMKFTLSSSSDEIADGFLGLKPLDISDVVITERRFDIDLPLETIGSATLEFLPTAHLTGTSVLRSTGTDVKLEVALVSEFTVVPDVLLGDGRCALAARTEFGEFAIKPGSWTFRQSSNYSPDTSHTLGEWTEFLTLATIIGQAQFSMTFHSDVAQDALEFNVSDRSAAIDSRREQRLLGLLALYRTISEAAKFGPVRFNLLDLQYSRDALNLIAMSLTEVTATFQCKSSDSGVPALEGEKGALVCPVKIMGEWIGFFMPIAVTAETDSFETRWTGKQSHRAIVERLSPEDVAGSFEAFRRKFCDLLGARLAFVQKPGEFMAGDIGLLNLMTDSARADRTPAVAPGANRQKTDS
ncbi:hypothetical protein [Sinorhizobium meliloti]|uniref:hypothetical protein n=1 Tax=Rhizobium meliloti TaxID=382 RepID=UPI000FDBD535|nr:hypothetical protein [Sinorhizobium meliloti]MDW9928078.1 hypothetical protein [Sinorhizobium meliloti]MDX0966385.1 hypothetical protein [Sinorhizobium medicae]RVI41812.1 hypothetical protein CN195_30930 [Sinorhizobium meliloti]